MRRPVTLPALTALCLVLVFNTLYATIRYVKPGGGGLADGSSWSNASGDLQAMINASGPGDQVWVAAGTYKPTTGTDRHISFVMKDGVAIYGGFPGAPGQEGNFFVRNWQANPSILSGDLNGDDVISGSGQSLSISNQSENSYHVVNNTFSAAGPLTALAILDGFTLTGGNANQVGNFSGAGMYNIYASPTLNNLIFLGNWSVQLGGGMYNTLGASPVLNNVTFSRNVAQGTGVGAGGGGGMYNWPGSLPVLNNVHFSGNLSYGSGGGGGVLNARVSPTFSNCSFSGNFAFSGGGGASNLESSPTFSNCLFSTNGANFHGGAVFNQFNPVVFTNCTFYGNTALYVGGITNNSGASSVLRNCIMWANTGITNKNLDGLATVTYSTLEGSLYPGTGNANLPPSFLDAGNPVGADGLWGSSDDGLRLQACSFGINVGDNTSLPATDFAGGTRIFNTTVDMGAYELQGAHTPLTFYRDQDNDGYGAAAVTALSCTAPPGYVSDNTDCNDNNAAVNPGVTENVCNGIDDDCSGTVEQDNIFPTALCKDISVALVDGSAGITAAQIDNGSSDNCSVNLLASPTTFDCSNLGQVVAVQLTATDLSGNTSTCTANVTVTGNCDGICAPTVLVVNAPTPSQSGTIATWTAPSGGLSKVKITAKGAKGGNGRTPGGNGAVMAGEFIVSSGQVLDAIAGAPGQNGPNAAGGGGGGSGVKIQSLPLIIAGAGGGGGVVFGYNGGDGVITSGNGFGGVCARGASGGGFFGGGCNSNIGGPFNGIGGGGGFGASGGGGTSPYKGGGGFGGGGGANSTGAGGGGYSGGNGECCGVFSGGGGSSYNLGSNQNNLAGANNGGGQVLIECLGPAVFTANFTPTQPACDNPSQGSFRIDLTGDNDGNTAGLEYAIVAGGSFTGTPTFSDITADPFDLTGGLGTVAPGAFTVRVRLKYNPGVYLDYTYTLNQAATLTYYIDADGDLYGGSPVTQCSRPANGYLIPELAGIGDCDDGNAAINPATVWRLDADNDDYYTGSGIAQCTSPGAGYRYAGLAGGGDCDDGNPSVNPGVTEVCNGLDDNCDGQVDESPATPPAAPPITTNNALNFDGTDDFVAIRNCGAATPFFPGGDAITVEYWFKGANNHSAVRLQPEGGTYIIAGWNGMHILSNDGGLSGIAVGAAATDGAWHHVAMTWQRNTPNGFKSYLDGQLADQRNSSDTPLPVINTGMYLGAYNGNSEFMSGTLDDVRIWTTARTGAEIQQSYCSGLSGQQTGLLHEFLFDHGDAGNDNTGIDVVENTVNANAPGLLNNFALNGNASNWVQGRPSAGNILYVNDDASGNNDGTSWTDAYTDLQSALNSTCPGITEIWVAAGAYYPTAGTDRNISFSMKNGVAIYGGFPNTDNPTFADRDWMANLTILSGEIGVAGSSDNTHRIINNYGLNSSAILDGFIVRDAYNPIFSGNNGYAGGIWNDNASPTIRNCIIRNNYSADAGGGVAANNSSPTYINCLFTENSSGYAGGAIRTQTGTTTLINCTIFNNSANFGGAISGNFSSTTHVLKNCIVWGNNAPNSNPFFNSQGANIDISYSIVQGGYQGTGNSGADPLFVSSTNLHLQSCSPAINAGDNTAVPSGVTTDLDKNPRFYNAGTVDMGAYEYQGAPPLVTCYLDADADNYGDPTQPQVFCQSCGIGYVADNTDCDDGNPDINPATVWYLDADNDDYYTGSGMMQCTSPGAGYRYAGLAGGGDCDDGNPAVNPGASEVCDNLDNNCNSVVDDGANCCPAGNVLYVNANAPGANNGASWTDAFTNLQDALAVAGSCSGVTEIWVAAGTYKPTSGTDRSISFSMQNNLAIYGGFPDLPGQEGDFNLRDWAANETILSGDIGTANDAADNSYHVILNNYNGLNNTAVLDGFTITGGNADGSYPHDRGGGMYNSLVSPLIVNCSFIDNQATRGGGVYNTNPSTPTFVNCLFYNNLANDGGGAINDISSARFQNCSFAGNSGFAISNVDAAPLLTNSIIWGNGAGIKNAGSASSVAAVSYSIVQGGYAGTGNLDEDPLFVDPAAGNFQLQPCSPAIDAGDNSANTTTEDLAGNLRVVDAAGAAVIDLGAYEFQGVRSAPVGACQNITVQLGVNNTVTVLASQIDDGSMGCGPLSFLIDGQASLAFDCNSLGQQMVTFTVTDAFGAQATCNAAITVADDDKAGEANLELAPAARLWPPDYAYQTFAVSDLVLSFTDACGNNVSLDNVWIDQVSSDEAEDDPSAYDGSTLEDIVISPDCRSVQLRRERMSNKNGRVYTITLAYDAGGGQTAYVDYEVSVPRWPWGWYSIAWDDGPVYTESCGQTGGAAIVVAGSAPRMRAVPGSTVREPAIGLEVYPNPFYAETNLRIYLPEAGKATIRIFNLQGQMVRQLFDGKLAAGEHQQQWNGAGENGAPLPSGLYLIQLRTGDELMHRKVLLQRF